MENKAKESMENPISLDEDKEEKIEEINLEKKKPKKGRPLGSVGKSKKLLALASQGGEKAITIAGSDFSPLVITVEPGEDLVGKVWSLGKKDGPNVCIFSATGSICKVGIHDDQSGEIINYEGKLEILYVKGSNANELYMVFANEDGIVYGGTVCGPVYSCSRVQVIAATFSGKGTRKKTKIQSNEMMTEVQTPNNEMMTEVQTSNNEMMTEVQNPNNEMITEVQTSNNEVMTEVQTPNNEMMTSK